MYVTMIGCATGEIKEVKKNRKKEWKNARQFYECELGSVVSMLRIRRGNVKRNESRGRRRQRMGRDGTPPR